MQYFFSTDITKDKIILSKEESLHCMKVLRHKMGDTIYVVDGRGNEFKCSIKSFESKNVELDIIDRKEKVGKTNHYIHIVISPTKSNQRFEWFIEKVIEIGVNEISFIYCLNSEKKKINIDRINKIILTAMKQSFKTYFPKINNIDKFSTVIPHISQTHKYIGYLGESSMKFLGHIAPKNDGYCLVIGPEGDFTKEEVNIALKYSFTPVLLSKSRLKTETAGIMGCMILNGINYE